MENVLETEKVRDFGSNFLIVLMIVLQCNGQFHLHFG